MYANVPGAIQQAAGAAQGLTPQQIQAAQAAQNTGIFNILGANNPYAR
jgi:hypothetical protein